MAVDIPEVACKDWEETRHVVVWNQATDENPGMLVQALAVDKKVVNCFAGPG